MSEGYPASYKDLAAFKVRRATTWEEVQKYHVGFGAKENWNTSLGDAKPMFHQDPQGFFLGLINDDEVIGTLQMVKYDKDYIHISAYQILKQHRGKGYGKQLWDYAWKYVTSETRTIGLDGAVAMQEKYKSLGFQESFYSYRYKTHSSNIKEIAEKISKGNATIKNGDQVDFDSILSYDTKHVGAPRSKFLRLMLDRDDGNSAVAVDNNNNIIGFAILRKSMDGYRFAQFFADSYEVAQELFVHLSSKVDGVIFIETPVVKDRENELHKTFNMDQCGENSRMYIYGSTEIDFRSLPLHNIHGVVWEFG